MDSREIADFDCRLPISNQQLEIGNWQCYSPTPYIPRNFK